jgi:hypothetical protein
VTQLLEQAFSEAAKLTEVEQNTLAKWLLAELASERRWNELFAKSEDLLNQLAEEALEDYRQGKTELLDPDNL